MAVGIFMPLQTSLNLPTRFPLQCELHPGYFPKVYNGHNPDFTPDLSQFNPNSTPDLSQLNPNLHPGPVTT